MEPDRRSICRVATGGPDIRLLLPLAQGSVLIIAASRAVQNSFWDFRFPLLLLQNFLCLFSGDLIKKICQMHLPPPGAPRIKGATATVTWLERGAGGCLFEAPFASNQTQNLLPALRRELDRKKKFKKNGGIFLFA